jgi:Excalibur calcium-binding domain
MILLALTVGGTARAVAFDCADTYCSRMSSCAEAHYKLTVCRQSKRDGDHDGIPCENVCGKTLQAYCRLLELEGVTSGLPAACAQR